MIPDRIKALRQAAGLSLAEFAKALATELRAITHWEAGEPSRRRTGLALILMYMLEHNPKRLREAQAIAKGG